MEVGHIIGIVLALVGIVAMSIYSGRFAKKEKLLSSWLVSGSIIGTLVGGSSTVGTAQLAYHYGMSAWWFTLGSGIACLILALLYVAPMRNSGCKTLTQMVKKEYGESCGVAASVLSSLGSFINIISQLIAATAIIAVIFPKLPLALSLLCSGIFMALYVIFGGTKGSGVVGIFKMLLLYATMLLCGILVIVLTGGFGGFFDLVNSVQTENGINFYNLFARGVGTDLGACLSLILGVITTQAYAQPILMARSTKEAKKGALLSAAIVPPVGIGGILVGLYMRATHPDIVAKTALTGFITEYLPPFAGGIALGALFIAVVGTGAGLAMGIAAVIRNDILPRIKGVKINVYTDRLLIVVILAAAVALSMGQLGDMILSFAFLSMGLRGATVFVPLCCAFWLSGKIKSGYAMGAIISGPLTVLLFGLWKVLPFDPLFAGVGVCALVMATGYMLQDREKILQ